jgi:ABC-type sugar transport system ATPase subunit
VSSTHNSTPALLEARGIVKTFGGATALGGVDLTVAPGEVHALLGANGAGKSTLIKVIAGIHRPDAGELRWLGERLTVRSLHDATKAGVAVMFQQLNVVEDLSVGQYLTLGRERTYLGVLDRKHSTELAREALANLGIDMDIRRPAGSLSVAERELIEIARAVSLDARLVIMDEPTASLGEHEVQRLFQVIRLLKAKGVAILYVSHKLDEILEITDRSTVLRDGQNAGEIDTPSATKEDLLQLMVGRQLAQAQPRAREVRTEPALELVDVCTGKGLRSVSLTVRRGEILGVYGLMGAGRTELLRAVYGLDRVESGTMLLDGRPYRPRNPKQAVQAGVGLVPEDRIREAMVQAASVASNLTLAAPEKVTRRGLFDSRRERRVAAGAVGQIGIKIPSLAAPITTLSGGNQQKVVFGRWLVADTRLLLLDDPTVGVDVAAKADIYQIIRDMTEAGTSVLVCSSELEELILLADRIAIMHQREIVDVIDPKAADAERVIRQSIVGSEETNVLRETL